MQEYIPTGFFLYFVLLILAGYIGRNSFWIGAIIPTIAAPLISLLGGETSSWSLISIGLGLLAGCLGAGLIPIFWEGRNDWESKGIHFINMPGAANSKAHYMSWIKDDNHPDNKPDH